MDPKQTVLDTLKKSDTPLKGGEIAELSGLEKKAVDKAIKQLKAEDLIDTKNSLTAEQQNNTEVSTSENKGNNA